MITIMNDGMKSGHSEFWWNCRSICYLEVSAVSWCSNTEMEEFKAQTDVLPHYNDEGSNVGLLISYFA